MHGTVDGMMLIDGRMPFALGLPARAPLLRGPVMALSECVDDPSISFFGIDNRAAGRDVPPPLADLGHQRLAHIAGPPPNCLTALRACGHSQGARERGCDALGTAVRGWSIGFGQAAAEILPWPHRPTAVFAANDEIAIGAIHAFAAPSVSMPRGMSVVGFDDIDVAAVISSAPSTIRQPRLAIGEAAVEIVSARIEGQTPAEQERILPFRQTVRASVGPPGPRVSRTGQRRGMPGQTTSVDGGHL